ncbi:hypothetical protein [Frondihabitans cladoniiphilus]
MVEIKPEWFPDGLFPANSEASAELERVVRSRTWVRLEADIPADRNVPPVWVSLGKAPDGRFVCRGLVVGALTEGHELADVEISSRTLRQIRMPELIEAVMKVKDWDEEANRILNETPAAPPRVRMREYADDHFRSVADAYRDAVTRYPRAPTKNLAAAWHVSEPTMRRWIQTARHKNFLGDSTPGKAGESKG